MNNATGIASNSTSSAYNYSNNCKYRLPCGWCDRRNCLCTYTSLHQYTTITGSANDGYYAGNEISLTSKVDNNYTEKSSVDGVVYTEGTRSEAFASSPVTTNI